jgi:xanthine dehydrogenase accessory factor
VISDTGIALLLQTNDAVLVTIDSFEGSSPREVGAWMLVLAGDVHGTVGGGNLEFQAIAHARELLAAQAGAQVSTQDMQPADQLRRYPLGPSLGQCCGGVVHLKFSCIPAGDAIKIEAARAVFTASKAKNALKIALFGGGHVGKALVHVLGALPCTVHWIDSRDEIFPTDVPANTQCEHSAPVHAAVSDIAAGSHVLIMSFSHAEDLDVVAQCLLRLRAKNDLPFIGLIGSKTKWATFRHRLADRGFTADEIARVTCPIGLPGVQGKEPEVIAVGVAAQLLRMRAATVA